MKRTVLVAIMALAFASQASGQSTTTDADAAQWKAAVAEYNRTGDPAKIVWLARSYCQRGIPRTCELSEKLERQLIAEGKRVPPRSGATAAASPASSRATPQSAGTTRSAAGYEQGEDATHCVSTTMTQAGVVLINRCPYTIEVTWCTENVDCQRGTYANLWTIGANKSWSTQLGKSGDTTRFAACKGRNSLSTNGTRPFSWRHFCHKPT